MRVYISVCGADYRMVCPVRTLVKFGKEMACMSAYIPTAIDEKAYEQAKKDSLAAFAPQGAALGSGFLAGLVITWLPGIIVITLLFLYNLAFGAGRMYGVDKQTVAVERFVTNLGAYSRVAVWACLVLGLYGVFQAWLRQVSCKTNRFSTLEMSKYGEMRFGLDAKLSIFGIPLVVITYLALANQLSLLIILLVFIVMSGMLYHLVWQRFDNMFLGLLFRPGADEQAEMAVRLMVPRHVGWKNVKISRVKVDSVAKSVRVEGEFQSDVDEKEARNIVGHFLRGYQPILIVNTRKAAS